MDGEGSEETLGNGLGEVDRALDSVVDREALRSVLIELPTRQRQVVTLSFFSEMTHVQIAGYLECSQMQVSRILRAALDQLRLELLGEQ